MAKLRVTSGPDAGQEIELEGDLVIGREEADVVLADEEVSRRHVEIRLLATGVEVEDLGSLNGTFVSGKRIDAPVTLTDSTGLRIGTTELAVDIPVPEPEDPGATRQGQVIGSIDATVAREVVPPELLADPDVTAQRPIADPDVTAQRPIADPDVTAERPIADPDLTAKRPVSRHPADEPDRAKSNGPPVSLPVLAAIVGVVVAIVLLVLLLG